MEKLYDIIRRRTAIEASILATSKKVDDAFTLAEKAFSCALERRLQSAKGHQYVRGSKVMCVRASVDPTNRRSQHDLNPQRTTRRPWHERLCEEPTFSIRRMN